MDIFHWKRRHNSFLNSGLATKKHQNDLIFFFKNPFIPFPWNLQTWVQFSKTLMIFFLILDFKNRYLKSFQVYEDWITSNLNYFRLVEHTSKQTTYHLSSHNAIAFNLNALVIFKLREI